MPSPEGLRPPIKRDTNPLARGVLSMAMAMAPANIDINPPPFCPTQPITEHTIVLELERDQSDGNNCDLVVRNPNQDIIATGYGIWDEKILDYGNIKDATRPANGVEYGEVDLKKAFELLQMLKDTHIDGVAWSWHSIDDGKPDSLDKDWRDKFLFWWFFTVMEHPDNPFKEAKNSIVYEKHSTDGITPKAVLTEDHEHLASVFAHMSFWRNEEGEAQYLVYAGENELADGNLGYFEDTNSAAEDVNAEPIFQDFTGSFLIDPEGKYKKFKYGFPFWQLDPPGIDIRSVATVTVAYEKLQPRFRSFPRDWKHLRFSVRRLKDNIIKALNSGKDVIVNTVNERIESSGFSNRPKAQKAIRSVTPQYSEAPQRFSSISSDQYISNEVQRYIDKQPVYIPPAHIPPAAPREIPIFGIEARRRKEEELGEPILHPITMYRTRRYRKAT